MDIARAQAAPVVSRVMLTRGDARRFTNNERMVLLRICFLYSLLILGTALLGGCGSTHYLGRTGPFPDRDESPSYEEMVVDGRSVFALARDLGAEVAAQGVVDGAQVAEHIARVMSPVLVAERVPVTVVDEIVELLGEVLAVDDRWWEDLRTLLGGVVARYDTPAGGDLDPGLQAALRWLLLGLESGLSAGVEGSGALVM